MCLGRGLWRGSCSFKCSRHNWDPPAKNWEWDSLQHISPWVQSVSSSVSHISFPISVIDVFRDPKTYWWERSMRGRPGKRKTSASWLCRQPQPNVYHSFRSVAGFPSKGLWKGSTFKCFSILPFLQKRSSVGVYFRLDPVKDLGAQKLNAAVFNVLEWNTEICARTAIWFRCFRAAQSFWQVDVLFSSQGLYSIHKRTR